jgi:hypothetical protein
VVMIDWSSRIDALGWQIVVFNLAGEMFTDRSAVGDRSALHETILLARSQRPRVVNASRPQRFNRALPQHNESRAELPDPVQRSNPFLDSLAGDGHALVVPQMF